MYFKEITLNEYGPIRHLKLTPEFDESGSPRPIVLIGQNGAGKTLFLSNLLHSLIELKRGKYNQIKEVSENNYYRVGSLKYVNSEANTSYNRIVFTDDSSFTEVMTKDYEDFSKTFISKSYPGVNIGDSKLKDSGFFSSPVFPKENVFEKEVYLFFPVERYYIPTWENKNNDNLTFITDEEAFVGKAASNMVQYNVLQRVEEWLLDVIIDKELYEKMQVQVNPGVTQWTYFGRNTNIQKVINQLLSLIYKHKGFDSARIAVTARTRLHRQIEIMGRKSGIEHVIMPSLFNMSSGEAMIIGMMAAILKEADRVCNGSHLDPKKIKGIVLIDEIDLHLHSDLMQKVLPDLISFFPEIQFVVSSHSPFFLLGMQEYFPERCSFIELPSGVNIGSLIDFNEIRNSFDLVNKSYTSALDEYRAKIDEMLKENKPLIITEGKTDWKHFKHALKCLQDRGEFTDIDVCFYEYEENMGADKLEPLLDKLAMVPRYAPVIGIFDDDSVRGKKYIQHKHLGNKVFGCSITDTQGYGCEISVELLYSRQDIVKKWPNKRRLFLSDEFTEKSHLLKEDNSIVCQNRTLEDAFKRGIIKVIDSGVYNSDEKNIAVSKEDFASQVLGGKPPYKNVNIDGFRDIFETIRSILSSTLSCNKTED